MNFYWRLIHPKLVVRSPSSPHYIVENVMSDPLKVHVVLQKAAETPEFLEIYLRNILVEENINLLRLLRDFKQRAKSLRKISRQQ